MDKKHVADPHLVSRRLLVERQTWADACMDEISHIILIQKRRPTIHSRPSENAGAVPSERILSKCPRSDGDPQSREIRRASILLKGKSIKEIARGLKISRNTVRKVLRSGDTSFSREREVQPRT